MVTIPENFIYIFPLVYGLLIGILELMFVHADEQGLRWVSHGLHALPWCIILTYVAANTWVVAGFIPGGVPSWALLYVVPIVLGLFTTFKVKAAAAIAKGGTVGEKFVHALIIGLLVGATPVVFWLLSGLGIAGLEVILR